MGQQPGYGTIWVLDIQARWHAQALRSGPRCFSWPVAGRLSPLWRHNERVRGKQPGGAEREEERFRRGLRPGMVIELLRLRQHPDREATVADPGEVRVDVAGETWCREAMQQREPPAEFHRKTIEDGAVHALDILQRVDEHLGGQHAVWVLRERPLDECAGHQQSFRR